ncbi:MAG: BTAD domain-containing putative transcriptional regulator [Micromonosporaceae bacterium]
MASGPAPSDEIEIRLLGNFELARQGVPINVAGDRPRAVLTALALAAGEVVAADALADAVWWDGLPGDPRGGLQNLVTRLRRLLGADVIKTSARGYSLGVSAGQVDAVRFVRLVAAAGDARAAGDPETSRNLLAQALRLWRGEPLTGVTSEVLRDREAPTLTERYLSAVEQRVDLDLAAGHSNGLASELMALTARHPLRESLWARLLHVLHAQGRQSEALEAYHLVRSRLADELGVDPSAELQHTYQAILAADVASHPATASAQVSTDTTPATDRATPPRQLPPNASGFVGRAQELAALDGAYQKLLTSGQLDRQMVTVIHGPGGVGKTALAVRWAYGMAEHFPDGQLYLDLRGYGPGETVTPSAALSSVLRALGVQDAAVPVAAEERAAMLRTMLADRRVLMVLDNANSPDQVRPLLPGSDSVVLITSRSRLRGLSSREGAMSLPLREMNDADARQLLAETVGTTRVSQQPEAATELAALCGRLPLALRITAHLASQYSDLPLADLAAELRSQRLDLLADLADPRADPRAVFSWSYQALAADDARVFRLLSLMPGDTIGVPAAAVLLDSVPGHSRKALDSVPGQTRKVLDRLVAVHLLESPRPGRYRFHELLRVYAAERTEAEDSATDRAAALHRVLMWYAAASNAAVQALRPGLTYYEDAEKQHVDQVPRFADATQALDWYDVENDSMIAAVRRAAEAGEHHITFRLAINIMNGFVLNRPLWQHGLAICEIGLAAARRTGDAQAEAALLCGTGNIRSFLAADDEALRDYQRALELYRACGARAQEGMALAMIATVLGAGQSHEQAIPLFEQAVAIARERHDESREAHALNNMAISYLGLGRIAESIVASQRAIEIRRKHHHRRGSAYCLDNLGDAYYAQGEYERAADCYREALVIARELRDPRAEGIYLANLARAEIRLADPADTARRSELTATARRASETLAGLPDTESHRIQDLLHKAFPDLDEAWPATP